MSKLQIKPETSVFSPKRFGEKLRDLRVQAGFSSADKFISAIKEQTGVYIDKASMLRIERGQLDPSISRLIAMCRVIANSDIYPACEDVDIVAILITYAKPDKYLFESNYFADEYLTASEKPFEELTDNDISEARNGSIDYFLNPFGDGEKGKEFESLGKQIQEGQKDFEALQKRVDDLVSQLENISHSMKK